MLSVNHVWSTIHGRLGMSCPPLLMLRKDGSLMLTILTLRNHFKYLSQLEGTSGSRRSRSVLIFTLFAPWIWKMNKMYDSNFIGHELRLNWILCNRLWSVWIKMVERCVFNTTALKTGLPQAATRGQDIFVAKKKKKEASFTSPVLFYAIHFSIILAITI